VPSPPPRRATAPGSAAWWARPARARGATAARGAQRRSRRSRKSVCPARWRRCSGSSESWSAGPRWHRRGELCLVRSESPDVGGEEGAEGVEMGQREEEKDRPRPRWVAWAERRAVPTSGRIPGRRRAYPDCRIRMCRRSRGLNGTSRAPSRQVHRFPRGGAGAPYGSRTSSWMSRPMSWATPDSRDVMEESTNERK